ncbi:unnamed protein product [Rotaria sp. Silwood1]|nr:unnamed protein product [Rotaria sp. Silwood1]
MQDLQGSLSQIEETIRKLVEKVSETEERRHQRQQLTSPPIHVYNTRQEKLKMQDLEESLSQIERTIRKLEETVSEAQERRNPRQQQTLPRIEINNIQQEKQPYRPPPIRPPNQLPQIQPGGALELTVAFINTNSNVLSISVKIKPNALALLTLVVSNA